MFQKKGNQGSKGVMKVKSPEIAMDTQSQDSDDPSEYEVKDWADTIHRAHGILKDKSKMKHVQKHIDGRQKAVEKMKSLAQVRASAEAVEE